MEELEESSSTGLEGERVSSDGWDFEGDKEDRNPRLRLLIGELGRRVSSRPYRVTGGQSLSIDKADSPTANPFGLLDDKLTDDLLWPF